MHTTKILQVVIKSSLVNIAIYDTVNMFIKLSIDVCGLSNTLMRLTISLGAHLKVTLYRCKETINGHKATKWSQSNRPLALGNNIISASNWLNQTPYAPAVHAI